MRITLDIDFDTDDATPEDYQILKAVSEALAGRPAHPEKLAAADEAPAKSAHKAVQELEKTVEKAAKKTAAKQTKKVDKTPEPVEEEMTSPPDDKEISAAEADLSLEDLNERAIAYMSSGKEDEVAAVLDELGVKRVRFLEEHQYGEFLEKLPALNKEEN